ncbi:methionine synthase [bacterium BMS3Abin07]|nr:methionine synthase [bacterium BMS3Abin07]GBE32500.1 methionine synthase [bacterium BMS3Bbin05]HDL20940.1 hypothetical protein [Nitrospirota bacterium]HDO22460.1 hypothetical protein [Nitrospirota bacterium]HDZ88207.1 hypothetical protein [Nitrospirota bacterium]
MFGKFITTGIGSMPHTDPGSACEIILEKVDIPFWPQLPGLSFRELMIPQYSEGLPSARIDVDRQRIWVERNGASELNDFYETYTDNTELEISEDYSRGFYQFIEKIRGRKFPVLKGQVTGPLTFTLGLKDDAGVPIYFNEEMREVALMVLKGKVRWQMNRLREFCDRLMIFIDEPILSALGTSSYMGVSDGEVKRLLGEIVESIRNENGISAIHCCGKADWEMVMKTGIDVVNFDAYDYFENFRIYSGVLSDFLERGGYIAWGIVPTGIVIDEVDTDSLKDKFLRQFDALSERVGGRLTPERLILTPACGAGSLREDQAEQVFDTLYLLKQRLLNG